jgi:hypothetical protein
MQHVDIGSADASTIDVVRRTDASEPPPAASSIHPAVAGLAVGRALFAVAMLAAPGVTGRLWLGGHDSRNHRRLMRLIAVRDIVLSAGTLSSTRRRPWLLASATADASDAVVSIVVAAVTRRVQPLRVVAMAVGGAISALVLAPTQADTPACTPSTGWASTLTA